MDNMNYSEEDMQLRINNTMLIMFCRYGLDACKQMTAPPEVYNAGLNLYNALAQQIQPKTEERSAYESEES
jgi:hypothetical protein